MLYWNQEHQKLQLTKPKPKDKFDPYTNLWFERKQLRKLNYTGYVRPAETAESTTANLTVPSGEEATSRPVTTVLDKTCIKGDK